MTKVNGFQPLRFVTKISNLDFAVVLDTPRFFSLLTINSKNTIKYYHNFRMDSEKDAQGKKRL